ncbi:MAG: molybdenum cofactor biosynthesis protein MoaE [Coraliomargarita sp. TMED73]|nr:MAG: molybdenum cofactor biosynthesis protein MoaE [Coraliomargarita sp. TMED73]
MSFQLTENEIDPAALRRALLAPNAGAYSSYEGWVRDHNEGRGVTALHYHAYAELAPAVGRAILDEATGQFHCLQAAVVHRAGSLQPGDIAVWIGVTAHHRGGAFQACRYLIEEIKHRLPVWKKETYADGSHLWIENHDCGAHA